MPAGSDQRARPRTDGRRGAAQPPAALSNLSGRDDASKLAASVASRIVDEVVAQGWPIGQNLGPSADLLVRFDVSRAVFREAVRLLENQGVARTRRGPGGGLIVAEPSMAAVTDAAVLYLRRVEAHLDEVLEARRVLEEIEAELAPARSGENPALRLMVDILTTVSGRYAPGARRNGAAPVPAPAPSDGVKLAEGLARDLADEVVSGRLEPGSLLGSEADLMERYGVSRAALREAARLLEHHQIARMRRGRGGGLLVVAPSSAAVADVVAIYLASRGVGIAALAELRARVEAALVDRVVERMDDAGAAALEESLEVGEDDERADVSIHNLHVNLARLSGNRALELVALVLIRLTRFHQTRALSAAQAREVREEVNRVHLGIAQAIEAQDRELARKRIRRHLDVLTTHLR